MINVRRVCLVGHFGFGHELVNGQTVKTKNLSMGLQRYGNLNLLEIDTYGWSKHPLCLFRNIKRAFIDCDVMIMLPAHNGVKIFAPLFDHLKRKYQKSIIYDVIGGWLPEYLDENPRLMNSLSNFDGIWVETQTMRNSLIKKGLENVITIPNFKDLKVLSESELVYPEGFPLKLCTFSRVSEEKGIGTAVDAIEQVNKSVGFIAFTLDIYGPVADVEQEWFDTLRKRFPKQVKYKGCIDSNQSVKVLQAYYALLFPTQSYSEGIPGTIIDAYFAGIPVISSKWESYNDLIEEGITGIGYSFDNNLEFRSLLFALVKSPERLLGMKKACLEKAKKYAAEYVIKKITQICNDMM